MTEDDKSKSAATTAEIVETVESLVALVNKLLTPKFVLVEITLLLTVILLAAYSLSLISPGLLDEQFLISWLHAIPKLKGSSGYSGLMAWSGFESFDGWGWATKFFLLFFAVFSGKGIFLFKLVLVLLHAACTALTYYCSKRLCGARMPALIAAIFFACFPLNYEASAWLGGIGSELATFYFLIALLLYMQSRQSLNWLKIAAVCIAVFVSISSSVLLWPCCLAFGLLELVYLILPETRVKSNAPVSSDAAPDLTDAHKTKKDFSMSMIGATMPIIVVGMYLAATLGFSAANIPELQFRSIVSCLRHMFMPINEINWHHYSREYRFLYCFYPFLAISAIVASVLSRELRRGILYSVLLFLILLFPLIGTAGIESDLYGERWLYAASVPFCIMLGFFAAGFASFKGRFRFVGIIASLVLVILLSNFNFRHLRNEIAANRNYARVLKSAQKAMKESQEKGHQQVLILRDLPEKLSICPIFSPRGPAIFDPSTGLLSSNSVPDGRLKDLLREGKMRDSIIRWERDLRGFLPIDLNLENAAWPESMPLAEFAFRMRPGMDFYKNIHFNQDKTEILLESISDKNGPMITLATIDDLSTLDGDFISIDAAIDVPAKVVSPRIELHWITRLHPDYDKRERFSFVKPVVNDGKVHRYLLSCRSNGWTSGGAALSISLGFPEGSHVRLCGIGLVRQTKTIAKLSPVLANLVDTTRLRFNPPYFDYPVEPQLGMIALSDNAEAIIADYAVTDIPGADGVLLELSYPNKSFDDANSDHLSGQTYKTFSFKGTSGKVQIPIQDLPSPGVYSIRVIATSAQGDYLGQFSDALCYQVPRRK